MITGLDANTLYHFWVAALYGTSDKTPGLISQRMSIRTDPANNAPSTVGNLEASRLENGDVHVTWTAAQQVATGCPVTKHVVTKNSRGGDRGTKDIGNVLFYVWPATGNMLPATDIRASDYYSFSVTPYCVVAAVGAVAAFDVAGEWANTYLETGPATGELPVPQIFLPKSGATYVELKWYIETDPAVEGFWFEVQRRNMAHPEWEVVTGIYPSGDEYRTTLITEASASSSRIRLFRLTPSTPIGFSRRVAAARVRSSVAKLMTCVASHP